ncbi:unnamed protein product [Rotaria sp. Silwood1]|nr:unnamed protein product [Rotaria sp. Silwood1]
MHQYNCIDIVIVWFVGYSIIVVQACSVLKLTTPEELVSKAHVIIRATAVNYEKPPKEPNMWTTGIPDSIIKFEFEELIKGNKSIPIPLLINGYLSQYNDFNDHSPPYMFVRPGGRRGSCIANTYKQDAEFLLFLNDKFTPYWDALTPVNEQLYSPSSADQWLQWVKNQVASSAGSRLRAFFH